MRLQQNRSAQGGAERGAHAQEENRSGSPAQFCQSFELGADFAVVAAGLYQFAKPVRLLAALEFEDFGARSRQQRRWRLDSADPARCECRGVFHTCFPNPSRRVNRSCLDFVTFR
jgi:hypothetical protein